MAAFWATFDDIESKKQQIATACWAIEARAVRSLRWSHIVTVDVIRRDQLAAHKMVQPNLVTDNEKANSQEMENADKYVTDFLKESAAKRTAVKKEPIVSVSSNGSKKKEFLSLADDPF